MTCHVLTCSKSLLKQTNEADESEKILSPFTVALMLSMSQVNRLEEQVF